MSARYRVAVYIVGGDDDGDILLDMQVEVPSDMPSRVQAEEGSPVTRDPISLQAQLRTALEQARPSSQS